VLAISDKVIIRAEDLQTWFTDDLEWNCGLKATYIEQKSSKDTASTTTIMAKSLLKNSQLDFSDIEKEKWSGECYRSRRCRVMCAVERLCSTRARDVGRNF
jgi:hypothetical protein